MPALPLVLVHGWNVQSTAVYAELAPRLVREAAAAGLELDCHNIYLSQYISTHNALTMTDLVRAFDNALHRDAPELFTGPRFACITHSTGGPLVRVWLQHYYGAHRAPLSHLIMLAPTHYGAPLAQVGKSELSQLKARAIGSEPGIGILDWLELGSAGSLALADAWLDHTPRDLDYWPFVLHGQHIDRSRYDPAMPYTGETGSDGVSRVAGANLNTRWLTLAQPAPVLAPDSPLGARAPHLALTHERTVDHIPMGIIPGRAHSGTTMGIMEAVKDNGAPDPVVDAIIRCLSVSNRDDYAACHDHLADLSATTQHAERLETLNPGTAQQRTQIHDPMSMLVVRVTDTDGHPVPHYDLSLTTGTQDSTDALAPGLLQDVQQNQRSPHIKTYYLNYALLAGCEAAYQNGVCVREAKPPMQGLGLAITPYPLTGFVRYLPAVLPASEAEKTGLLKPNQTTVIDIVVQRIVAENTFEIKKHDGATTTPFAGVAAGAPLTAAKKKPR